MARGLSSCGSWALEHGLTVVADGLGCSVACGIFPDQGSNLCLLHKQAASLPLSHQESPAIIKNIYIYSFYLSVRGLSRGTGTLGLHCGVWALSGSTRDLVP